MLPAFRSRNYALFWAGSFVSNVGTWMQSVALGWLIYEMTGSASWLGTVSFAANAPALFVGLIGGAVADRVDRRFVLVGTQLAAATSALLLGVLTACGVLEVWQVLIIALASGSAQSLYTPVVQATIPALVPVEDLLSAVSLNSVQFNLARILGPLAAGFAYAAIGAAGCFFLNGLSFFVLALALSCLRLPTRTAVVDGSIRKQLADGLRYARSQPLISTLLAFAAAVSLMGFPYIVLLPAVARDTLHLGPAGLGLMMGSIGLGAVVGGLVLATLGDVPRKALLSVVAGAMLAAMLVGFSLTTTLRAAAPFLFLLGIMQVGCAASLTAVLQLTVTEAMRGRVMSMLGFAYFGLSTLGSVLFGLIGDRIGVAASLRLGGIMILLVTALIVARSRRVLFAA
jgi:MFS family permease